MIPPEPTHGGICPLCREEIKRDALKCKHCGATFGGSGRADRGGDCGCEKQRQGLDPSSVRISDPDPAHVPPQGTAEMPQSYRCTACKDTLGTVYNGPWTHSAGKRTCSMLIPIRVSPSGVITWKKIEWTEDCLGTLVNDPWA